jgi:hypothetical protein
MKKKLRILPSKGFKSFWSVLAPDAAANKKVQNLDNLMSLLQEKYQFAEVVTVPAIERAPGKDKSDQTS